MSEITRISQFKRFNMIDFAIVVIAICSPYIFDGLQAALSGIIPTFKLGIIPKNIIAISVLFFRIAIAKGQNPYSDNSISMIVLAIWSLVWVVSYSVLDNILTTFLLKSIWYQVIYWIFFVCTLYFFLFELTFRKKKIVEARTKMNNLEKEVVEKEDLKIDEKIANMKAKIEELSTELKGSK